MKGQRKKCEAFLQHLDLSWEKKVKTNLGKLFQQQGSGGTDSLGGHQGGLKPTLTVLEGAAAAWGIIRGSNPV